jgi:ATP-dependent RNA helicase DeaD
MPAADLTHLVGPALASALAAKGYDTLTPVQEAVLDDALEGRDLRITSQTGSGKTLAIGFAVRDLLDDLTTQFGGAARPRVLILAPTRELAKQVAEELSWLYAPLRVRVAAVTGGAGYLDQKRALSSNPAVVVATPGRLRDALERGRIDATALGAVVLDEADSMLDLGFREDLDAILAKLPAERRSHLVSATFSRDVVALADRFQKDPVHVEGTRLGDANSDIQHVIHLVEPSQRIDALVNLLLSDDEAKSLVFVRTRADVARIAGELAEAGFVVRTLSGEMEQPERDRALAAFRQGGVQALVATDVAARGIDVRDIARVIQVEPPTDVETYTHRSGRTGRAGRQGTSVLFVTPSQYPTIARGLARAKIAHRVEQIPRPDAIQRAREEKLVTWLARDGEGATIDPHAFSIAEQVLKSSAPLNAVARLIEKAGLHGPTKAREVRLIPAPREGGPDRSSDRSRGASDARRRPPPRGTDAWVTFRVTWGGQHGADARRLLAVACRRGNIRGSDVGAIRVEGNYSLIDVARDVAPGFESEASKPDPRDPLVRISRNDGPRPSGPPPGGPAPVGPSRANGPSHPSGPPHVIIPPPRAEEAQRAAGSWGPPLPSGAATATAQPAGPPAEPDPASEPTAEPVRTHVPPSVIPRAATPERSGPSPRADEGPRPGTLRRGGGTRSNTGPHADAPRPNESHRGGGLRRHDGPRGDGPRSGPRGEGPRPGPRGEGPRPAPRSPGPRKPEGPPQRRTVHAVTPPTRARKS